MPSPGFLFRAQPSLMTLDRSATIMDAIFASPDEESRGRLLRIMQEFLVSEAAKHSTKEKGTVCSSNLTTDTKIIRRERERQIKECRRQYGGACWQYRRIC
jgi:hypothetical protein